MNLVIKNLCVVAAMALLVALAGIANADTIGTFTEDYNSGYTEGEITGQNGWSHPGTQTNVTTWDSDEGDGGTGVGKADQNWGEVIKSHGLTIDTTGQVLYKVSADVKFAPWTGDVETTGATAVLGWSSASLGFAFHVTLGVNDRWNTYAYGGGPPVEPGDWTNQLGEKPGSTNAWYTVGIDWNPKGEALAWVKRKDSGALLASYTYASTALFSAEEDFTHVVMNAGGWDHVLYDNYKVEGIPESPTLDFTWNTTRSGDWNVGSNWTPVVGPPGNPTDEKRANHSATFGDVIQSNRTVFVDDDVSVRAIVFDNTNTYVVAGPGSVNLVQGTAEGPPPTAITVNQGSHQFQAAVNMMNNTSVDVASGATLLFNNVLNLMSHTLTKSGDGVLEVNNRLTTAGGSLNVLQGTVAGDGTIGGNVNNDGGAISPGTGSLSGNITPGPELASWLLLLGGLGVIGFVRCSQPHRAFARIAK